MQKLEKSVQAPAMRVGSILLLTWLWRATLIGSLLLGYYGGRGGSSDPPAAHAPRADPQPCLVLVSVDDGQTCRLEAFVAPGALCRPVPVCR